MNHQEASKNGDNAQEQSAKASEGHAFAPQAFAMNVSHDVALTQSRTPNWVAIVIIAVFWIAQFGIATAVQLISSPPQATQFLIPRTISAAFGALISFGMLRTLEAMRDYSLVMRAMGALILAMLGALVLAAINYPVFLPFMERTTPMPLPLTLAYDFLVRLWAFIAISAIFLSLSYFLDVHDRENRIHALQALAHSAQMRALRNQLNPHFLFNALNSIAGLISAKRVSEAEGMTENLADFLRLTLGQDPQKLITLNEELQLQGLYLDIEKVRFPERLLVSFAVPDGLRHALVPSLITQPLIENSIKYAVARSTEPVQVRISAEVREDCLEIIVEDSGGNAENNGIKGAHMGLSNVAERLKAHYGDSAALAAAGKEPVGFRNVVRVPLRFG